MRPSKYMAKECQAAERQQSPLQHDNNKDQ